MIDWTCAGCGARPVAEAAFDGWVRFEIGVAMSGEVARERLVHLCSLECVELFLTNELVLAKAQMAESSNLAVERVVDDDGTVRFMATIPPAVFAFAAIEPNGHAALVAVLGDYIFSASAPTVSLVLPNLVALHEVIHRALGEFAVARGSGVVEGFET